MEFWFYPAIIAAGIVAGFINTLAGSGSLITLPLLIFMGLPAQVANGTNRIAILFQNMVGVHGFHKENMLDVKRGKWLLLPSIAGALLGAQIAADLDERLMRLAIGAVMCLMLVIILVKPKNWLTDRHRELSAKPTWMEIMMFFGVGIYGGFIQAGVGIFLLAALVLGSGYDLVKANAVKVLIVLGFTPFALAIFIFHDQVIWTVGLIMAIGNMAGAWLATKVAVKKGAPFVRWVLIAVVSISALKLFWDVSQST